MQYKNICRWANILGLYEMLNNCIFSHLQVRPRKCLYIKYLHISANIFSRHGKRHGRHFVYFRLRGRTRKPL